ncbi:hypothetical protein [Streptomyces sp.]
MGALAGSSTDAPAGVREESQAEAAVRWRGGASGTAGGTAARATL